MSISILATTSTSTAMNNNNNNKYDDDDHDNEKDLIEKLCMQDVHDWDIDDVSKWAVGTKRCSEHVIDLLKSEEIDGEVLLSLTEADIYDFRYRLNHQLTFSELKKLWLCVSNLQQQYYTTTPTEAAIILQTTTNRFGRTAAAAAAAAVETDICNLYSNAHKIACQPHLRPQQLHKSQLSLNEVLQISETNGNGSGCSRNCTSPCARGSLKNIPPEYFKTLISLCYSFLVTWITSFVMVIVHERVPDMKRYPPLPDIFLDNVPHIPWAFHMCEITGTLLFFIWTCVIIFHKYRTVLLRRFFALAGTVFLLRCVTMLITSLSVPGAHLQCDQNDLAVDDTQLSFGESLEIRVSRAYIIWSGLGMSIKGVRTCGDYMFSGHTVALTLLNFFITEYTPRNLYFLHTLTWLLNMFGIFFILAAHEHYSIDVFVAFYITSRLFLYYHTLANNQALMSQDSTRTRIWFPMFSYFESSVECIVPNEYDSVQTILNRFLKLVLDAKDVCMLTGRRIWLHPPQLAYTIPRMHMKARNMFNMPRVSVFAMKRMTNASTSTSSISNIRAAPSAISIDASATSSLFGSYWNLKNFRNWQTRNNHVGGSNGMNSDPNIDMNRKLK